MDHPQNAPNLTEATRVWGRIGLLSFGGPAAQIALMHKEIVEDRAWLTEQQYLNALSFCMLLPGPEAMQLATYAGWRLHGFVGGLIAGLLFVLPGACVIMALATIYSLFGEIPLVDALFFGIKAAVLVIVVEALLRVAKKALGTRLHWIIAASAFVGIFFLALPYPVIVALAACIGGAFAVQNTPSPDQPDAMVSFRDSLTTVVIWCTIWIAPFVILRGAGANDILIQIGAFFSRLAVVTFGGAYAVLAYMAQDVVGQFGWLSPGEMVGALGLAETTPGPLILVTQFVGFLAGFQEGGLPLGFLAAFIALWVTFVPCFLWIFVGAPYITWISAQPRLRGALAGITAAVVGVILNLSVWFALHVFFGTVQQTDLGMLILWVPEFATVDWRVIALFALSCVLAFVLHWGIVRVLAVSAICGCMLHLLF